jgi:Response regulator containing CheY-like receiver, AAA-type ATPase, and DNA-binding domains
MLNDRISILVVSPQAEDHRSIRAILRRYNWTLHTASSIAEALGFLETNEVPVIVCERELPDGSWKDLLEAVAGRERPPRVVVMSALAEERLWLEVLNLGGYDLLLKPLDSSELFRVLAIAARSWLNRHHETGRKSSLAAAVA